MNLSIADMTGYACAVLLPLSGKWASACSETWWLCSTEHHDSTLRLAILFHAHVTAWALALIGTYVVVTGATGTNGIANKASEHIDR